MLYSVCSAAAGGSFLSGASHIIEYKMLANASFGPYQMFNYIPNKHQSVGSKGVSNLVGKSVFNNACSSFPQYPKCGQCTDNKEGNWFSFPRAGQCDGAEPVGTNGCTWNVTSYAMKNMSCVSPRIKDPCVTYLAATTSGKPDPVAIGRAVESILKELATAMSPQSAGGCREVPLVTSGSPFIIQI